MDDNRSPFFPPEALAQIRKGKVFSGGIRHKEIGGPLLPAGAEWISITVPLDRVFSRYEEIFAHFEETATDDSIIVFASGDPLFFGFANTIKRKLPEADILLYPAFNSLQTLAHRLVMPYDDMRTVSLTGRPWQEFDRALIERAPKIGILTDREHTPVTIAARMLKYGYSHYTLYIGEHLGNPEKERIRRMTPREAVAGDFEHPNCLLLDSHPGQCRTNSLHGSVQAPDFPVRPFGIPDEEFAHLDGRARMITKAPIRLLTLQAFEIRPEGKELMDTNSRRFGAPGITAVTGDFLHTDLTPFARPDAVFIGGHGGHLEEMIEKVKQVLHPEGCIVFNSVSAESKEAFCRGIERNGMVLHPSTHIALNEYNPIEIMKATLS